MRIVIGSDHAGFALKEQIKQYLIGLGVDIHDVGVFSEASADYPDIAREAATLIAASNGSAQGILICGTGVGVSITANRVPHIRAALASDPVTARLSRDHNNANVLCMGSRIVGIELAKGIVDAFLQTPFSGDSRHQRRIDKIEE
ncbi:MAG: ribose 5-phosphate isomerase B [Fimbriimonadia bacterium]|nr:ribose 5-phosphate isomerase B [Fimbriimonadia bacterium]